MALIRGAVNKLSWGAGCSCFEGGEDTTMSDEPTELNFSFGPDRNRNVTDEKVISRLNGSLTKIDLK